MPEMDGLEAMREIRKRSRSTAKLPIIALTAKAMQDDRERCLDAGANDYIAKPLDVDKLLSLLRVWMPQVSRSSRHDDDDDIELGCCSRRSICAYHYDFRELLAASLRRRLAQRAGRASVRHALRAAGAASCTIRACSPSCSSS